MDVLQNKCAWNGNGVDILSVSIHDLQNRNVVLLPKDGEALIASVSAGINPSNYRCGSSRLTQYGPLSPLFLPVAAEAEGDNEVTSLSLPV